MFNYMSPRPYTFGKPNSAVNVQLRTYVLVQAQTPTIQPMWVHKNPEEPLSGFFILITGGFKGISAFSKHLCKKNKKQWRGTAGITATCNLFDLNPQATWALNFHGKFQRGCSLCQVSQNTWCFLCCPASSFLWSSEQNFKRKPTTHFQTKSFFFMYLVSSLLLPIG